MSRLGVEPAPGQLAGGGPVAPRRTAPATASVRSSTSGRRRHREVGRPRGGRPRRRPPSTTARHPAHRVVAVPAGDLDEGGAACRRRAPGRTPTTASSPWRSADSSGPTKKSAAGDRRARPPARATSTRAAEQRQHRGHLAGRVGVRDASRPWCRGCGSSGGRRSRSAWRSSGCTSYAAVVALDVGVPGQRADRARRRRRPGRVELGEPVDVDEVRRARPAAWTARHQALPAGQHLGVAADLRPAPPSASATDAGAGVGERGRLHAASLSHPARPGVQRAPGPCRRRPALGRVPLRRRGRLRSWPRRSCVPTSSRRPPGRRRRGTGGSRRSPRSCRARCRRG